MLCHSIKVLIALWIACCVINAIPLQAQNLSYRLVRSADIKTALVSPYKNVIKMYDLAIDEERGRAYTSGSQTRFLSVIDLASKKEIGSVTLPFDAQLATLKTNPANGAVLVTTPETTPVTMYAINPDNSAVLGTYSYTGQAGGLVAETAQNRIFASDNGEVYVLDGTTLTRRTQLNVQIPAGGLALDTAGKKLYVCSRNPVGGNVRVRVVSTTDLSLLSQSYSVPSGEPLGEMILDLSRNRFFLFSNKTIVSVDITTGAYSTVLSLPAPVDNLAYYAPTQTFYMTDDEGYNAEGQGGAWSKQYRYNLETKKLDSLRYGDKTYRLRIDTKRDLMVSPSMHSGWVEILNLKTNRIDSVDIGESLDFIAASPDSKTLYMAKRLGGSKVLTYDVQTGATGEFKAGQWPAVTLVDSTLAELYVLNMFESTVSVFSTKTNALLATVRLGFPECRTDAIVTMCLDAKNHKIYVAAPEYAKISELDMNTRKESKVLTVPGFTFDLENYKAIGILQLAAAPDIEKLFVLHRKKQLLLAYNTKTGAWDSTSLASRWKSILSDFESDNLHYDATGKRLFVGNLAFNPTTLAFQAAMASGARFVGYNKAGTILYSLVMRGDTATMVELNPTALTVTATRTLFIRAGGVPPVLYLDVPNNALFIGEFNYAKLYHFDLTQTSSTLVSKVQRQEEIQPRLSIIPHPVLDVCTIRFQLERRERVWLALYDQLGREVLRLLNEEHEAGEHNIRCIVQHLPQGFYTVRLQTPTRVHHKSLRVIR